MLSLVFLVLTKLGLGMCSSSDVSCDSNCSLLRSLNSFVLKLLFESFPNSKTFGVSFNETLLHLDAKAPIENFPLL